MRFENKALRMDYLHTGSKDASSVEFLCFSAEPFWGGSKRNLIDDPLKGEYVVQVFDTADDELIYSKGFSTLFNEWQTTDEASNSTKTFYESILIPFPKQEVRLQLSRRNKEQQFHVIFETTINPFYVPIAASPRPDYNVVKILDAGDPSEYVDLVFLPEGYTRDEMDEFRQDVKRLTDAMFSWSPYEKYQGQFNIWIVEAPSEESGTDIPQDGIWKNTILNSGFDTFGIDRYLTTSDFKSVRDLASCAPYDQICIIVNHYKYGGCGIYNFYTIFTADNEMSEFLFMHEFGHGFVALADEYYSSDVPYTDFFDLTVEPYQENITTLIDFKSKWEDMLDPDTPVPTPDDPAYYQTVGVFEGAGYQAKGIYRPYHDCTMKSKTINNFCPVCQRAIQRTIEGYMD
ncbi:MAG: peptidase M64 [Deltaproteobacteria bacterium]|nr:peptidase M64 [Deltaproteobacteria bacterium]